MEITEPTGHISTTVARALASNGTSSVPLYEVVSRIIRDRCSGRTFKTFLDVGCGRGQLPSHLKLEGGTRYIGIDVAPYPEFPRSFKFIRADFNADAIPIATSSVDLIVAAGVIEYLENPRRFARELVRCCAKGGFIVLTTPNQVSLLSRLTLLLKGEFSAFRAKGRIYRGGMTALLPIDLLRMADEVGIEDAELAYSNHGRIPATGFSWPATCGFRGQLFSDDVILSGFAQ